MIGAIEQSAEPWPLLVDVTGKDLIFIFLMQGHPFVSSLHSPVKPAVITYTLAHTLFCLSYLLLQKWASFFFAENIVNYQTMNMSWHVSSTNTHALL